MSTNRKNALRMAKRPYIIITERTETTDDESIYVSRNPELEGCIAQGDTLQEAQENLAEIRIDYIEHLLENGLSVPDPGSLISGEQEVVSIGDAKAEENQQDPEVTWVSP